MKTWEALKSLEEGNIIKCKTIINNEVKEVKFSIPILYASQLLTYNDDKWTVSDVTLSDFINDYYDFEEEESFSVGDYVQFIDEGGFKNIGEVKDEDGEFMVMCGREKYLLDNLLYNSMYNVTKIDVVKK